MCKSLIIFLLFSFSSFAQKEYSKIYYPNGNIKEQGWQLNGEKTDYWYFYSIDGTLHEKGHFAENKKVNWWIFYSDKEKISKKCEYINDKMNGLCIIYTNEKISKAEKYNNGKLIKSWTDLSEFKKDNNI
jgi:antitoxin component YwqK of YwqJK toxin-antitoxin module